MKMKTKIVSTALLCITILTGCCSAEAPSLEEVPYVNAAESNDVSQRTLYETGVPKEYTVDTEHTENTVTEQQKEAVTLQYGSEPSATEEVLLSVSEFQGDEYTAEELPTIPVQTDIPIPPTSLQSPAASAVVEEAPTENTPEHSQVPMLPEWPIIPTEIESPAEEPVIITTEPAECSHDWHCIYHEEAGHWLAGIICDCGWTIYGSPDELVTAWNAHSASFPPAESLFEHGGYGCADEWIVDTPASEEWVCSRCGKYRQ